MFELFLTLIFVALVFYLDSLTFTIIGGAILLVLILPGLYSMFFGAPFIRTSDRRIEAMLRLGDFNADDVVVDLGCGDGKVLRAISREGIKKVYGYEFSIPTYFLAKLRGVDVRFGNFWKKDFSGVDAVICFLLERTMKDFEKKIWPKLSSGTRVLSNEFVMDGVKHEAKEGLVYLYVKK